MSRSQITVCLLDHSLSLICQWWFYYTIHDVTSLSPTMSSWVSRTPLNGFFRDPKIRFHIFLFVLSFFFLWEKQTKSVFLSVIFPGLYSFSSRFTSRKPYRRPTSNVFFIKSFSNVYFRHKSVIARFIWHNDSSPSEVRKPHFSKTDITFLTRPPTIPTSVFSDQSFDKIIRSTL